MNPIDKKYKMPKLLCCPFCGQDAEMHCLKYPHLNPLYWVSCTNCSAEITNVCTTEEEAKDAWNRREKDGGQMTRTEEPVAPVCTEYDRAIVLFSCRVCKTQLLYGQRYCHMCGKAVKWP